MHSIGRNVSLAAVALLLCATPPVRSTVSLSPKQAGCILLKPDSPLQLQVARIVLALAPGYYQANVRMPRCDAGKTRFVVGTGWNRNVNLDPGIAVAAPRNGVEEIVDVYPQPSSGIVIHDNRNLTKVVMHTEDMAETKIANRNGHVWYFDFAGVGRTRIVSYVESRPANTVSLVLKTYQFVELFQHGRR